MFAGPFIFLLLSGETIFPVSLASRLQITSQQVYFLSIVASAAFAGAGLFFVGAWKQRVISRLVRKLSTTQKPFPFDEGKFPRGWPKRLRMFLLGLISLEEFSLRILACLFMAPFQLSRPALGSLLVAAFFGAFVLAQRIHMTQRYIRNPEDFKFSSLEKAGPTSARHFVEAENWFLMKSALAAWQPITLAVLGLSGLVLDVLAGDQTDLSSLLKSSGLIILMISSFNAAAINITPVLYHTTRLGLMLKKFR